MKPLYEINEEFQNWLLKVEDNEGEVTEELMTEFENISCDFEVKAEAYAVLIKQKRAETEALKAEKDRLGERQAQAEKTADRLAERLTNALNLFGKDKFETIKCKVSFRTSKCVEITDETLIPDEFFKITKTPCKADIKTAINEGKEVNGAIITEKKNIQIK